MADISEGNMTPEEHLHRINGIRIVGSGDHAKVIIRGLRGISNVSRGMGEPENMKDINLSDSDNRQPLFIIDDQKAGRNCPDVRDMFTRGEIKSVKHLSDSKASQYGSEGGNGVIVITAVSAKNNNSDN